MQFSPSNKVYAKALDKLRSLTTRYSSLRTRDPDEIAVEVSKTLQDIRDESIAPTMQFDKVEYGEVPSSFKMNEFLTALEYDINVAIDEMEILRASSIHTHNFIKTELLKSQQENERLHNKLKTLQLYGSGEDASIIKFGDSFYNDEYIDWNLTPTGQRVSLVKGDHIAAGIVEETQLLDLNTDVTIESGSNGIPGNNKETVAANSTIFKEDGLATKLSERLSNITDQSPTSVFQFEQYELENADLNAAQNYNFTYFYNNAAGYEYLENLVDSNGEFNWATGVSGEGLTLKLMIDIGSVTELNLVSFMPFGLADNRNHPMVVKSASYSADKNTWYKMNANDIWIANGIDQNLINLDDGDVRINQAFFRGNGARAQYIMFELFQPQAVTANVGHIYYVNPDEEDDTIRYPGPVPAVDRIWQERETDLVVGDNLVQRREVFNGKRWVIGIRDISATSTRFAETSVMVSKKFYVPNGVDRVALEADTVLPDGYSLDRAWVRFYISPDEGLTWHQISRIQDDFLGIPEIIAYNDQTPAELRLPGVSYEQVNQTPDSLMVKIEIDRDFDNDRTTPIVRSYELKIKQRTV